MSDPTPPWSFKDVLISNCTSAREKCPPVEAVAGNWKKVSLRYVNWRNRRKHWEEEMHATSCVLKFSIEFAIVMSETARRVAVLWYIMSHDWPIGINTHCSIYLYFIFSTKYFESKPFESNFYSSLVKKDYNWENLMLRQNNF